MAGRPVEITDPAARPRAVMVARDDVDVIFRLARASRVHRQGQAPEVVRVPGRIPRGGDAYLTARGNDPFWLSQVLAQLLVHRMADAFLFIDAEQAGGQGFAGPDGLRFASRCLGPFIRGQARGEVYALHT